jgi:MarC family integral membrane protein
MDHTSIDFYLIVDTFLFLLIGVGPKIALVPFLEVTAAIDDDAKGLAVPYLLNPVGVVTLVTLVTLSAEADSIGVFAMVVALLVVVLALDVVVFRVANRASRHLDEGRMLVTEKIFGMLLAALAVQLVLNGLDSVGIIHLAGH